MPGEQVICYTDQTSLRHTQWNQNITETNAISRVLYYFLNDWKLGRELSDCGLLPWRAFNFTVICEEGYQVARFPRLITLHTGDGRHQLSQSIFLLDVLFEKDELQSSTRGVYTYMSGCGSYRTEILHLFITERD
jgi:hypothetical protein